MNDKLTTEERAKLTVLMKAAFTYAAYAAAYAYAYEAAVEAAGSEAYKELLSAYEATSTYTAGAQILKEGLEK